MYIYTYRRAFLYTHAFLFSPKIAQHSSGSSRRTFQHKSYMVFFKEEITNFQLSYFEKTCAALDSEKEMQYYCRDVFRNGKDALDRITLDLTHRYMFDTKYRVPRWGLVDIPHDLIDQCAARILAKVVVLHRLQAEEETRRQAEESFRAMDYYFLTFPIIELASLLYMGPIFWGRYGKSACKFECS